MPYSTYNKAYRRPYRSRRYTRPYNRRTMVNTMRRVAVQQINRRSEHKFFDVSQSIGASTTASVVSFCNIPQGDTDVTRDGDKLWLTGCKLRVNMSVADTTNFIRIIVFQWRSNDAQDSPTAGEILEDLTDPINTPYNHDGGAQFTILWDRRFGLNTSGDATKLAYFDMRYLSSYKKKFIKKQIKYVGGTVNGSNKLFYLVVSDSTAATHPTVNIHTRVNYLDS